MKKLKAYTSFNHTKTTEELHDRILRDITNLENIKFELNFYKSLLSKSIFKPQEMNLYENLVKFKRELHVLKKANKGLLSELNLHVNQIKKMKIEGVVCDSLCIKKHDDLELKIFSFKTKIFDFKFRLFQYLESVFIN
ncbi:hypothetical protein [Hwangdonia lutea]|uniref:Uncharacterized protein n=1 Tax=Hwangdonia lutea TaxID=3075823 RepID=A0AA97EL28_9FLAO|nr:hypothetical protein [Hwangdonia sp. SCSIO 19198]WOD42966.1 hypothetical protein RNZ46_13305 [Hwangdonia sp. SCSIO 19198]